MRDGTATMPVLHRGRSAALLALDWMRRETGTFPNP